MGSETISGELPKTQPSTSNNGSLRTPPSNQWPPPLLPPGLRAVASQRSAHLRFSCTPPSPSPQLLLWSSRSSKGERMSARLPMCTRSSFERLPSVFKHTLTYNDITYDI